MELRCPNCGLPFRADDVDLGLGIGKCRGCDRAYPLKEGKPASLHRPPMERPSKIRESTDGIAVNLSYSWFDPSVLGLAFFAVFWDGFLVVWYTIAFKTDSPLIMKIFPILHVAVGVGITYAVLCGIFNRTTITLDGSRLKVRTKPIPNGKNQDLGTDAFQQLFVSKKASPGENRTTKNFDLSIQSRDGVVQPLIKSLPSYEVAAYLEQRIESYFGIADARVSGEHLE